MPEFVNNYNAVMLMERAAAKPRFNYQYKPSAKGTVNYQADYKLSSAVEIDEDSALATMIASEGVLARDWDSPEDNAAWADL